MKGAKCSLIVAYHSIYIEQQLLKENCGEGIGVSEKYVCPTVHSKADVIVSSTLIHDGVVITLGVLFWSLLI